MDFAQIIRERYSVRAYRPDPIEPQKLERVLEAGLLAPSAANRQPLRFIVADMSERREEMAGVYNRDWFLQAPLLLVVCGVPEEAWVRGDGFNSVQVDAAIAMDHMILAATEEGLGTCWISSFDIQAARKAFNLPADVEPIVMTPLGYADDQPMKKVRKPKEALFFEERLPEG